MVDYLLACSGSTLKNVTFKVHTSKTDCLGKFSGALTFHCILMCLFEEHLVKQSITHLEKLASLTFVVSPDLLNYMGTERFCKVIRFTATILERINRGCLTYVLVEFKADPLVLLGGHLVAGASAPLQACKQLEAALLTFPNALVLVRDPTCQRANRAKLWPPIIRRAFPRLDDRGLLALKFTPGMS